MSGWFISKDCGNIPNKKYGFWMPAMHYYEIGSKYVSGREAKHIQSRTLHTNQRDL
jgi:hypothetical protein